MPTLEGRVRGRRLSAGPARGRRGARPPRGCRSMSSRKRPAASSRKCCGIIRSFDAGLKLDSEIVPDIDWVARSLEGLKPVRAGGFFVHGAHDRASRRPGGIAIEIEAGLAFGTGHHGTTAGCLEMIAASCAANSRATRSTSAPAARCWRSPSPSWRGSRCWRPTSIRSPTSVAAANVRLNGASRFVTAVTATGFHHPAFAASAALRPDRRQHPGAAADAARPRHGRQPRAAAAR